MRSNFLDACRSSIQFKLFISLTTIVAISLAAILVSQVYLVQNYFIRQAESNLRSSNYLLSRVLADPLFANDLTLLQARLEGIQSRLPLCNFQLKDNLGKVIYTVGAEQSHVDTDYDLNSRDGCYNTIMPVVRGDDVLGMVRMGVRTDDIAKARQSLIRESIFFAAFWFVIFMLPFFVQIRRMIRPLGSLSEAAHQFAGGNLDYPAPPPMNGHDEISRLTTSFQGMAQALLRNRDEQAASMAELSNEKSTLDALLATIPVGVIFADHSHIRYCNSTFCRMLGMDEKLVGLKNDAMLLRLGQVAADADAFLGTIAKILETRSLTEPGYIALKDGRMLRVVSNIVIKPDSDRYIGRFWLFEDATEERRLLQNAEMRGEHDSLTLLYNRQRYDRDLQRAIAQAERDGSRIALLIFDLDDFKPINDRHGHASGDIVLKEVAETLSSQLRRNEVLYRIGGDEFALLLINASDEEAAILADRIVRSIYSLTFKFNNKKAKVGCSLGVARYPDDAKTIEDLMQFADRAMYKAKNSGKNQYAFSSNTRSSAGNSAPSPHVSPFGDMNLGISIIDEQHSGLARFIKGLLDSIAQGDRSVELRKRIETLFELCKTHYQTKKELMKIHDLPGAEAHHRVHQQQLRNLRKLFKNLNLDEAELDKLTRDLKAWLIDHIEAHDTGLAAQLISHGVV